MTGGTAEHWQQAWEQRSPEAMSWYEAVPVTSLELVERAGLAAGASVVDVGGGASTLVDHLVERGLSVTVLDVASSAIAAARARLGADSDRVTWTVADVTTWTPPRRFDCWHDRAVFHFLVDPPDRQAYAATLRAGTAPGSWVVLATFAPDAPTHCSGLPVARYDADGIAAELGDGFEALESRRVVHTTPAEVVQPFTYLLARRRA